MKAMIFAAGLGTRLKPLTSNVPKALVTVSGKPMLLWVAEKLINAGATEIIINVHHHAEKLKELVSQLNYPKVHFVISDETTELMDTGGGLKKASEMLQSSKPVIIHNTDVLSDISLTKMLIKHKQEQALATLAVSERTSSRLFLWYGDQLAGWQNCKTGEKIVSAGFENKILRALAFSGIHVVDHKIFSMLNETGPFSITNAYLRLSAKYTITPFEHDPTNWIDIGTPEKLKRAEQMVKHNPEKFY